MVFSPTDGKQHGKSTFTNSLLKSKKRISQLLIERKIKNLPLIAAPVLRVILEHSVIIESNAGRTGRSGRRCPDRQLIRHGTQITVQWGDIHRFDNSVLVIEKTHPENKPADHPERIGQALFESDFAGQVEGIARSRERIGQLHILGTQQTILPAVVRQLNSGFPTSCCANFRLKKICATGHQEDDRADNQTDNGRLKLHHLTCIHYITALLKGKIPENPVAIYVTSFTLITPDEMEQSFIGIVTKTKAIFVKIW
jgi:hypothetical protein